VSAVSDEREYAAGIQQGVSDHLAGRAHRDMHQWVPRFRHGYQDGWDLAPRIKAEAAEDWALLRATKTAPKDTPPAGREVRLGWDFLGSDFPF
jgi:hypothetical protein